MKLWLITRMEEHGYDEFDAKVVSAPDESEARRIAALRTGDEGQGAWLEPGRSMVTEIGTARDSEHAQVILESFNAR